jgi:hypothetical protein
MRGGGLEKGMILSWPLAYNESKGGLLREETCTEGNMLCHI